MKKTTKKPVPAKKAPTGGQHRAPQVADTEKPIDYPPTVEPTKVPATPLANVQGSLAAKFGMQDNSPHLVVEARAGTGKTTTLVSALQKLKGITPTNASGQAITPSPQQAAVWDEVGRSPASSSVTFVAFNKSIATELQARVPSSCQAMTMHSMGFKAVTKVLGRLEPTEWAVQDIISDLCGMDTREMRRQKGVVLQATDKLVGLCKMNLTDTKKEDSLEELASYYDVDLDKHRKEIFELVPQVLERCKNPKGRITYDDMIWLPVALGLSVPQADVLLVDEAQDLNRCQQALAKRAGRRLILCGDPRQAIYGFAGADSESMSRMEAELREVSGPRGGLNDRGCRHLPLTVTRRCGKAIVAEAQQYVPDFSAHESNGEGRISDARYPFQKNANGDMEEIPWADSYMPQAKAGDMVLCRMNAPLVTNCFRFLRRGIKANIQGRDVGRGLIATVNKLCKETLVPVSTFIGMLSDWYHAEYSKENAKKFPSETKLTGLQDRYECLVCFAEGAMHSGDVVRKIEEVFTDNKTSPGIKLSSVHKAKGLEAPRVFFLKPPMKFSSKRIPQPWEIQQSENLEYVAITRAIEELTYVR